MQLSRLNFTNPNSVDLGQQFGVVLLNSFQTLEHGCHMGLAQQKGIIWTTDTGIQTKRGKEIR